MKIVHLSECPEMARTLNIALNKHTSCESQCFDLREVQSSLSEDLIALVEDAEIIHIHGSCDLENEPWVQPLKTQAPKARWVQQYYSIPKHGGSPQPQPKVSQFAFFNHTERYLPYARVMPSVVLESEIKPISTKEDVEMLNLALIQRGRRPAWEIPVNGNRWECEGFGETHAMAEHLVWKFNHLDRPMRLMTVPEQPRDACFSLCQRADLLIDGLVTGSFYPSSLTFLALGIPCFIHLDNRCFDNILNMAGSEELPWIFTRVEEADTMIGELICDSELRVELGAYSREWIEQFYGEETTVQHYVRGYEDLLNNPDVYAKPRFDLKDPKVFWDMQEAHDTIYDARKRASGFGRSILAEDYREQEHAGSSHMFHFSRGPVQSWLYRNRFKRMDGLEPLFDVTRRQCLLERYAFAASEADGKRSLDLGSGTGYGSALLKSEGNAESVLGVDNDFFAVSHANNQYGDQGVTFILDDIENGAFAQESFELITAFEILECVKADGRFLDRCHEWLKPGGMLFLASPDTWHDRMMWGHRRNHSRITFENFVKRVFPNAAFFIQEPAFQCSEPAVFEPKTIRPCIPEDYLDPGQVMIAKCVK